MKAEESFFIQILADHLSGKKTICKSDINWKYLFEISNKHKMQAIVYYQCRDFLPIESRLEFKNAFLSSLFFYGNYKAVLNEIRNNFTSYNIQFVSVKGISISKYYPIPELRTMGDLDIVIQQKDRFRADKVLAEKGFIIQPHVDDREWIYCRNGITIELHDYLVYNDNVSNDTLISFFNNHWSYVDKDTLDVSFHFLFLLFHLRKHLMNYGVGFRMFYDIALMSKNENGLKWKWIIERLNDTGLLEFALTCFSLIYRWFGVLVPAEMKQLSETFYMQVTKNTFDNGVFGFDNLNNKSNAAVNVARNSRNYYLGMLKSAVDFVFPPYNSLLTYNPYRFVKGKPYLVPIAWIYRFYRGFPKRKLGKHWLAMKFVSKKTIIERDDYLKKWGL